MFIDLLRKRRSIRQFEDKSVEQEKVDLLIEALLRSPASRSRNPWEFVVVSDKETIVDLSKSKTHGSTFMKGATLAIVVCGLPDVSDVWVEDCSIATLLVHLAATDLGLGSCWVQIREREHNKEISADQYVRNCLKIPENLSVEAIVAVGYGKEEKLGHADSSLLRERVHYNSYQQD